MASGLAGELFVAAELLKRGCVVTVSFGNTKAIDLIVAREGDENNLDQLLTIDVKSLRAVNPWAFGSRRPRRKDNHFYVFCLLGENNDRPRYWLLSSHAVADLFQQVEERDNYWLNFNQVAQDANEVYENWDRLWQQ